jgi:hypothetical protein
MGPATSGFRGRNVPGEEYATRRLGVCIAFTSWRTRKGPGCADPARIRPRSIRCPRAADLGRPPACPGVARPSGGDSGGSPIPPRRSPGDIPGYSPFPAMRSHPLRWETSCHSGVLSPRANTGAIPLSCGLGDEPKPLESLARIVPALIGLEQRQSFELSPTVTVPSPTNHQSPLLEIPFPSRRSHCIHSRVPSRGPASQTDPPCPVRDQRVGPATCATRASRSRDRRPSKPSPTIVAGVNW